jgi:hypothetical protein
VPETSHLRDLCVKYARIMGKIKILAVIIERNIGLRRVLLPPLMNTVKPDYAM